MKITVNTTDGTYGFDGEPGETVLAAGLRNGIPLPYECATGTCGTCKARLIEGDVDAGWADAPGRSYVKQDKGEFLMCQAVSGGNCALRVPADLSAVRRPEFLPAHREGLIAAATALTHDVMSFALDMGRPFNFDAGQFVVLDADGVEGGRAYSMTNHARDSESLDFVVKRKPDGAFSDWLFDGDPVGRTLKVFGPLGRATFDPAEGRNMLCLGGGSGIAATMSILARAVEARYFESHSGDVFFGVRTTDDVFFLDRFAEYVEAFGDRLSVTVALSDEDPGPDLAARYPRLQFATGFVHVVAGQAMEGKYDNTVAYLGGPPPMVDGAIRMLILEARLSASDIRYDKFS